MSQIFNLEIYGWIKRKSSDRVVLLNIQYLMKFNLREAMISEYIVSLTKFKVPRVHHKDSCAHPTVSRHASPGMSFYCFP